MALDKGQLVVQEENKFELTNLSRNCILHALEVLPKVTRNPYDSSDSDKIEQFCREISETVNSKSNVYKKKVAHRAEDTLVDSQVISRFYNREMNANDFLLQIEARLEKVLNEYLDHDALFKVCWRVYYAEKKPRTALCQHFCDDSNYHLWLIFNAVLPPESDTMLQIPVESLNMIMKRMLDLCAHEPIPYNHSGKKEALEYLEYLQAIASYTKPLKLQPSLIHEVTQDMKDELVDGILKKGYLTKKGHKRKNWKRRWFVLEKTDVRYFESKENLVQKGHLVLNTNTELSCIPDRGKRMYCFQVTCGKVKTIYEIQCDDEKSRHDWMLAINKAIHLSKIFEGTATPDIGRSSRHPSLSDFHLIRFGLSQSIIPKWEGGVKIRQKPGHGFSTRLSISQLRKPKISMKDSDDEVSDEEDSKSPAYPIPNRRDTESWITVNISPQSESSTSVKSSVIPSLWGAFGEREKEHNRPNKLRATSDTLSMHSSSIDLPDTPDSEPTPILFEKDKEISWKQDLPDVESLTIGANSSPKLDQQDCPPTTTSGTCDPSAPRHNSAVGHIKKKPPPAGGQDSPVLPSKHTYN